MAKDGYCECGCGQRTKIAKRTRGKQGIKKGEPLRYVNGHNMKGIKGRRSHKWKGGQTINNQGYAFVYSPDHTRAHSNGYVPEHILVAEGALGKPLPKGSMVHHVNGIRSDNRKCNLVICQDEKYHSRLHLRMRAIEGCGDPNKRRCLHCLEWDDPESLYITPNNAGVWHRACYNKKRYYKKRKEAQNV
jgi:hypothetical protein